MRNPYNLHQQINHPMLWALYTWENRLVPLGTERENLSALPSLPPFCTCRRVSHARVTTGRQALSVLFLFKVARDLLCVGLIQGWMKNGRCSVIALSRLVPDQSLLKEDETLYTSKISEYVCIENWRVQVNRSTAVQITLTPQDVVWQSYQWCT